MDRIHEIIDRLPELKHLKHYEEICYELTYFTDIQETLDKLEYWGVNEASKAL